MSRGAVWEQVKSWTRQRESLRTDTTVEAEGGSSHQWLFFSKAGRLTDSDTPSVSSATDSDAPSVSSVAPISKYLAPSLRDFLKSSFHDTDFNFSRFWLYNWHDKISP